MAPPARPIRLGCIFLASGHSKRFPGNKLLSDFGGQPMAGRIFDRLPTRQFQAVLVVTRYPQVARLAREHGFSPVDNPDPGDEMAVTIRLGLEALGDGFDGCMFSVCDQPRLRPGSIAALAEEFRAHPGSIAALSCRGQRGNPVIFPKSLFAQLRALGPGQSGGAVIARHPELVRLVEVGDPVELEDVDRPADRETLLNIKTQD